MGKAYRVGGPTRPDRGWARASIIIAEAIVFCAEGPIPENALPQDRQDGSDYFTP
jgi:hypothetical protein